MNGQLRDLLSYIGRYINGKIEFKKIVLKDNIKNFGASSYDSGYEAGYIDALKDIRMVIMDFDQPRKSSGDS